MPSDNDFFRARNRADGFIPDKADKDIGEAIEHDFFRAKKRADQNEKERPMPTDPRSQLLMAGDTDDEIENIDIMLHALREATTEVERRRFARAIARYFEHQLVQLTDRMSALVNALSLENQVRIRLQPTKRGASEVALADGATKPYIASADASTLCPLRPRTK